MLEVFLLLCLLIAFVCNTILVWREKMIYALMVCFIAIFMSVLIDFEFFNFTAYLFSILLLIFTIWWHVMLNFQRGKASNENIGELE